MTIFQFHVALWGATVAYTIGDMIRCAGEKRSSVALLRLGTMMVAAAVLTLAALALELWQITH